MTGAEFYALMARCKLGVLGTVSDAGTPQSALIGFAITPELELIFDTIKSSRKYPNLIARPACSLAIGWADEHTVQYEGVAEELTPPDLERYQNTYFRVWPDGPSRMSWPGIVYFVVRPTWIRYSNFAHSPPFISESRFGGS